MIRLDKLLSNLGYATRSEVKKLVAYGVVTSREDIRLKSDLHVDPATILFDGMPLDPQAPLVIEMNKPVGYVCSRKDPGDLVFDLLPERMNRRTPALSVVGRLDKDSQGLLLLTDDGALLHQITHPSTHVEKEYLVETKLPLRGDESQLFSSGTFCLADEPEAPLLPATFSPHSSTSGVMILREGRYRQIRRMFETLGNEVVLLRRVRIGSVVLASDLEEGAWRILPSSSVQLLR